MVRPVTQESLLFASLSCPRALINKQILPTLASSDIHRDQSTSHRLCFYYSSSNHHHLLPGWRKSLGIGLPPPPFFLHCFFSTKKPEWSFKSKNCPFGSLHILNSFLPQGLCTWGGSLFLEHPSHWMAISYASGPNLHVISRESTYHPVSGSPSCCSLSWNPVSFSIGLIIIFLFTCLYCWIVNLREMIFSIRACAMDWIVSPPTKTHKSL